MAQCSLSPPEAWLRPLPAASFSAIPYLTPYTPATLKSLQMRGGVLFGLIAFACTVPHGWSLDVSYLCFQIDSVYIQINDRNLNMTDDAGLLSFSLAR